MLSGSTLPIVVINTTDPLPSVMQLKNLSEVESKLVQSFLNSTLIKPVVIGWQDSVRVTYSCNGQLAQKTIQFSKQLYRYHSKKNSNIHYAVVGSKPIGQGNYGDVYRVKYTLKINNAGEAVCKRRADWRALKVFYRSNDPIEAAISEHEILRLLPFMHSKMVECDPTINLASILMRFIPGDDLFTILAAHQSKLRPLSVLQRLELSRELFAALHSQVHQNGIIHRDVKPENVMVSFKSNGSVDKVTFIDYNFAKKKGVPVRENVGTECYVSPEATYGTMQTEESDLYSLGRVLWCVWGLKLNFDRRYGSNVNLFRQTFYSLRNLPFLFSDVDAFELSPSLRRKIHDLLYDIHTMPQDQRPGVIEVIDLFDSVIAEYKSELVLREMNQVRSQANSAASAASPAIQIDTNMDKPKEPAPLPLLRPSQPSTPTLFKAKAPSQPAQTNNDHNGCVLF